SRLRSIPHLEFIRIGSKQPVVQPMRVTPTLTKMLRRYHPLWMSLHFTHPDEVTPEVAEACGRLADAGIPLGSQTVLLKGVTDDLKDDYLALGLAEHEVAEFDTVSTIDAIAGALAELGHEVDRIGHVRALAARLVAGWRCDLVFNIAEGVAGFGRESQIPALL